MTDTAVFSSVRAQPTAVETLRRAVQGDRLPNAYLFEGPEGVGKSLAARALAAARLCKTRPGEGCGTCDVCTRIARDAHPDVRVFRPRDEGDRNLTVELIRSEVIPFTQFAPFESAAAFVIFPEADVSFPETHAQSANALLKTLEEPRPNVHFVLLSSRPQRLLSTIRSRCQRVRFGRLPERALLDILEIVGTQPSSRETAVAFADGNAARAISLAREPDAARTLVEGAISLDRAVAHGKPTSILQAAESLAKHDDSAAVLDALCTFYRDVAVLALDGSADRLVFRSHESAVRERAAMLSAARASARVALVRETLELMERNVNAELAFDTLLFQLASR